MLPAPSVISMPTSKLSSGAWLVVALLFFVGALNYLDRTMIITMRESIVGAMPMTNAQFGLLTSVFLWVYGLISPFAGFLADRFSRSRVIIVSLFVWSGTTLLTSYTTTFEQLLATRVLMGVSEACYIPAALALIVDYHSGTTRSLATGIHIAGIVVGQSLGFLGGWIAEDYDWTLSFTIFGLIGVIYSVVLLFILRDAPQRINKSAEKPENNVNFLFGIRDLFKRRSFILMLVFWSLLGIVGWMTLGWLPTFYQEQFKLSQGVAGLYATGYLYPASIIGVILGGYLTDRWAKTNPRAPVLVPIVGLCVAAPCIFIASISTVLPFTISMFFFYALTRLFSDANMMPILCQVSDPRYRATGYGILNMFACIVGGIGIYAGGIMRDLHVNLSRVFQTASILLLICIGLLYLIKLRPAETLKNSNG